jgi:putative transposase
MAHVKVWIHAVWGTKNREHMLTSEVRSKLCLHIKQNAQLKGFYIDEMGGYTDHLHALMRLRSDWSLAKQMQMIKGESSNWINKQGILVRKLEWADAYFASSVSESHVDAVRLYIRHQRDHHRKTSFEDEYVEFMKTLGLDAG